MPSGRILLLLVPCAVAVALMVGLRRNQGPPPAQASGVSVTAVAAGAIHTCALMPGGGVKCWGNNLNGQLGDGTTTSRSNPVDVCASGSGAGCAEGSAVTGVAALAAGAYHTCALMTEGGVKCWGHNLYGELGDGTATDRSNPVDVCASGSGAGCASGSALTGVASLAAGVFHTCALMTGGGVKCQGDNGFGQLGDGTSTSRSNPVDVCASGSDAGCAGGSVLTGVPAIAGRYLHTCALLAGGGVKCWGYNGSGQLGDGTSTNRSNPVDVSIDTDVDGCTDARELQTEVGSEALGGRRNYKDFWDFYDTPDASNVRNKLITLFGDIFSVANRFNANDAGKTATPNRNSDPLAGPIPAAPAYHPAFDRSAPLPGDDPWDLRAPDGIITLFGDIFSVTQQFNHNCN